MKITFYNYDLYHACISFITASEAYLHTRTVDKTSKSLFRFDCALRVQGIFKYTMRADCEMGEGTFLFSATHEMRNGERSEN